MSRTQEGFNKWIMTGHIVAGSRSEPQETDHQVPYCTFLVRDSVHGMDWQAVAYGKACIHFCTEIDDNKLYSFEGIPKQDAQSKLDVPVYHMQVLYIRPLPTTLHPGRVRIKGVS